MGDGHCSGTPSKFVIVQYNGNLLATSLIYLSSTLEHSNIYRNLSDSECDPADDISNVLAI
jgi:hypothetical protein